MHKGRGEHCRVKDEAGNFMRIGAPEGEIGKAGWAWGEVGEGAR